MKKSVLGASVSLLALCGVTAQAQEMARVMSAAPVVQQVAVPRQVCTTQQVTQRGATTGAGAVIGGVAGGVLGNQIGHGSGRAAATALGAVLGNTIEGNQASNSRVQDVQNCTTQTFYEDRISGYNVRYEYAGREYQTQMPYDPGPSIRVQVQVTPIVSGGGYPSR